MRVRTIALLIALALFGFGTAAPALAQQSQLPIGTTGLTLFTRYPSQELAVGEDATLQLTLRTGGEPQIVRLELNDLPEGWSASFRGDGKVVQSAYVDSEKETTVDLRIEPAQGVKAGVYRFSVVAQGQAGPVTLPIELNLAEKKVGGLQLDVELPTLKGAPDTTFRYNATLKNDSDKELAVNLLADAPRGIDVDFKLSGQSVTSVPLQANESKSVSIEAKLFPDMPAGEYKIGVQAQGGDQQAQTGLMAEVTGQPQLTLTAPDGRLSGEAYAGNKTPLKLIVENSGSAPARNIALSGSQPAGWKVEFEPAQIAELAAGQRVEVTANVEPIGQAIPGDYVVKMSATPEDAPAKSEDFRITVLTSTLWGIVGIVLIAVAVGVVGVAVMRFGRR